MNGPEKLRLVSVCDQETGVCLFQRAWQWRGDQERSSIGNLVQSFYQFAREVDQGEISCVNFLVQSSTHRRVSSSQATRRAHRYLRVTVDLSQQDGSTSSELLSTLSATAWISLQLLEFLMALWTVCVVPQLSSSQRGPSTRSLPDAMQMLCTRNEDIIVAAFFDVKTCVTTSTENQGSVREFLSQVKESFCAAFPGRVVSLRPTLKECADGKVHDGVLRSMQEEFAPFKESVDQIRLLCFASA